LNNLILSTFFIKRFYGFLFLLIRNAFIPIFYSWGQRLLHLWFYRWIQFVYGALMDQQASIQVLKKLSFKVHTPQ